MPPKTRVAILDDHQSIIDGYLLRLSRLPQIEIVGTAALGSELETLLAQHPVDVLLLDLNVPTSPTNPNPYPILHVVPQLLQTYPDLAVLVVSMLVERALIRAVMEAGASGYLLKEDKAAIQELGAIVLSVASGGVYLSRIARQQLFRRPPEEDEPMLTARQLEALSLSATYPDGSTAELAAKMRVSNSTVRNLLSEAYLRLGVHTRAAAVARARQLGLITPEVSLARLEGRFAENARPLSPEASDDPRPS